VLPAYAQPAAPDPDAANAPVKPRVVSQTVKHDSDDPAIWINCADLAKSLVIGTD
jgi:3-phytase